MLLESRGPLGSVDLLFVHDLFTKVIYSEIFRIFPFIAESINLIITSAHSPRDSYQ